MMLALAASSAPGHPARAFPQKKKPQRCANSGLGRVENPSTNGKSNMSKIAFPRSRRNLHRDLPLFRFTTRADENHRLTYPERRARIYLPGRPDSTVRLYARLAGFKTEG